MLFQDQVAVLAAKAKAAERRHTEQDDPAIHARIDRGGHVVKPDRADVQVLQPRLRDLDAAVRGHGNTATEVRQVHAAGQPLGDDHGAGTGVHQQHHVLAVDAAAGVVVMTRIGAQAYQCRAVRHDLAPGAEAGLFAGIKPAAVGHDPQAQQHQPGEGKHGQAIAAGGVGGLHVWIIA